MLTWFLWRQRHVIIRVIKVDPRCTSVVWFHGIPRNWPRQFRLECTFFVCIMFSRIIILCNLNHLSWYKDTQTVQQYSLCLLSSLVIKYLVALVYLWLTRDCKPHRSGSCNQLVEWKWALERQKAWVSFNVVSNNEIISVLQFAVVKILKFSCRHAV